jgi:DNA-binding NtrC family response regulator
MMESARICLIDDDIYVRDSLALGLREAGDVVPAAPSAVSGLDFVRRHGADAIVTDMRMPGTTGAELIAQAGAAWPLIAIIAISGAGAIDGRDVADLVRERRRRAHQAISNS